MTQASAARPYIRRETQASIAINSVLSAAFYALVFGRTDPVPVWGIGNWVFDFAPQSFMIALMSTLVPGALTARKLRSGKVAPMPGHSAFPRRLPLRALLLACGSVAAGTALVAGATAMAGVAELPMIAALPVKVGYGALLAAMVTPIGLRAALRS